MPEISIITPIYIDNPDKLVWLSEMIQSLQSQTRTDWECILVDDCSPLLLGEVKLRFEDDKRLRWLKNAHNYGPAMTRNSAVAISESNCILPIDADDMLASPEVLARMYQVWEQDKTKTVFGNLQVLEEKNGNWELRSKPVQLAEYSFENAMNLLGVMPVTAMHSKDCWLDSGGWDASLHYGREDVEYWISAGKAGYCGQKINYTTLIYRRHNTSRDYRLKNESNELDNMSTLIMNKHSDVFNGDFSMCGCNKSAVEVGQQSLNMQVRITTLDNFPESEKIWVEYKGARTASFGVIGRTTRTNYMVQGQGHKMQVHMDDLNIFKGMDRGTSFIVGIPEPRTADVASTPAQPQPNYTGNEPQLATLERLDTDPEPEIVEQPLTDIGTHPMSETPIVNGVGHTNVSFLRLSENLTNILTLENWSIEKLAEANTSELTVYRGIGEARATQIVESAKQWLGQIQ